MASPKAFSGRLGSSGEEIAAKKLRFAEPSKSYAPFAFWLWDGYDEFDDPGHFAKQVRGMAAQGLNPGYFHARYYNAEKPLWLTERWHACAKASIEAAAEAGSFIGNAMGDPCFPDKYLLPSHPELKAESLSWSKLDLEGGSSVELPKSFFAVAAPLDASGRLSSSGLTLLGGGEPFVWNAPEGSSWRVYLFKKYHAFHPGGTFINVLDRRITAPWLDYEFSGYEKYAARHFGAAMDSVFFDHEGSYGYKLAWSRDLPELYKQLKGSDIRLWMPLLIEEDFEGRWLKARWDWFDAVGRLYADCLIKPLDAWAKSRGLAMTCHFWEESLQVQALQTGSFFALQRACSMPGVDALFLSVEKVRPFKETQSVCEFEGRQFMCEALGIAGWHLSPAMLKRAANCAIARGVTRIVLHSVSSCRKLRNVSYPPDFYDWNPYWSGFKLFSDFARRACGVNDQGRLDVEVLLLCPMDSVWALLGDGIFDPSKPHDSYLIEGKHLADAKHYPEIKTIEDSYSKAIEELEEAHVEHLIADSHYFEALKLEGPALKLGSFSFKAVVLPPLRLLPLAVARKLADFAENGGVVCSLGALPDASAEKGLGDHALASAMHRLRHAQGFRYCGKSLAQQLREKGSALEPSFTFESGAFPLLSSRRLVAGRLFLWLANNGDEAKDCVLRVPKAAGAAAKWNCESGAVEELSTEELIDASSVALRFEAGEAFWLVFDPAAPAIAAEPSAALEELAAFDGLWAVSGRSEGQPDLAQHKLAAPAWLLDKEALRPLESWLNWDLRQFSGFVSYRRDFEIEKPDGSEVLDLGLAKHVAEVRVNGVSAGMRLWAPFKFEIGKLLKPGSNSLEIRVGNLLLNAVTQYENYKWKWHKEPDAAQLDAGLFGPVRLFRTLK